MRHQKNVRSRKNIRALNKRARTNIVFSAFAFCAHAQKSARAEARAQEKHAQGERAHRKISVHHNVHVHRTRACAQRAHAKMRAHFYTLIVACARFCGTRKLRAHKCARAKKRAHVPTRVCLFAHTFCMRLFCVRVFCACGFRARTLSLAHRSTRENVRAENERA